MSRRRIWEIGATSVLLVAVLLAVGAGMLGERHRHLDRELESVLDTHNAPQVAALVAKGADIRLRGEESDTTVLMVAAAKGNIPLLDRALAGGADVHTRDTEGNEALTRAAGSGNAAAVRRLLAAGAKVSSRNGEGRTPLMRAAEAGVPGVVRLLLEHGSDVSAKDRDGKSALQKAKTRKTPGAQRLLPEADYRAVIQLLQQHGAR